MAPSNANKQVNKQGLEDPLPFRVQKDTLVSFPEMQIHFFARMNLCLFLFLLNSRVLLGSRSFLIYSRSFYSLLRSSLIEPLVNLMLPPSDCSLSLNYAPATCYSGHVPSASFSTARLPRVSSHSSLQVTFFSPRIPPPSPWPSHTAPFPQSS